MPENIPNDYGYNSEIPENIYPAWYPYRFYNIINTKHVYVADLKRLAEEEYNCEYLTIMRRFGLKKIKNSKTLLPEIQKLKGNKDTEEDRIKYVNNSQYLSNISMLEGKFIKNDFENINRKIVIMCAKHGSMVKSLDDFMTTSTIPTNFGCESCVGKKIRADKPKPNKKGKKKTLEDGEVFDDEMDTELIEEKKIDEQKRAEFEEEEKRIYTETAQEQFERKYKQDYNVFHVYDYSLIKRNPKDLSLIESYLVIKHILCGNTFEMKGRNHAYNIQGCPQCYGNTPHTEESFIEAAKRKHVDENGEPKFEYTKTKYVKYTTPIIVVHKKCGRELLQLPRMHLSRGQCGKCVVKRLVTLEEIKARLNIE